MIKIAHTTLAFSRLAGGLQASVSQLATSMRVDQHLEVRVFGPSDPHVSEDLARWHDVEVRVLPTPFRRFGYMPSLQSELLEFKPDLLHCHGLWLYHSLVALRLYRKHRQPYMISPHGMLDSVDLRQSRIKKAIAWKLYQGEHLRSAKCLRALSNAELKSIRDLGLRGPVCVIPNGLVPIERRTAATAPWDAGFARGRKVLLYLSRIHPKKGLRQLVDGLALLKSRNAALLDEWCVVIVGWDQRGFQAELRQRIEERGLAGDVHLAGPLYGDAKDAAYQCANAFVLPSTSEGVPNVVLEAWSVGLPVLMTPECNLPQAFGAGAAVEANPEPESLYRGLKTLFTMSEEARHEMGRIGDTIVRAKYNWAAVSADMLYVTNWILGGGSPPSCVDTGS